MAEYKAPLRDVRFLLDEVFRAQELWASVPALRATVDPDTAAAILEEAAKITTGVIAPLNRVGDEEGSTWLDGQVSTATGFREAYRTYADGGWNALTGRPEHGGMGMPKLLVSQVEEMLQGACMSFGLAPMLTSGAALLIDAHADDAIKRKYLPNMYAGIWAGTMDMTEPHAGTDLGIIRTKAEPRGDGSYSITGTKIFITWGEHDMAENILHLVLARLPDAPEGTKGISLFLVPKFIVADDGSLAERNTLSCGSLEKKMGIKASPTCVMDYDGAQGWLIGEPHRGLAHMFTMMNYERVAVGVQGVGAGEASYQNAVQYARERLQSRSPRGPQFPNQEADPIIVHPDVRRMLLSMRAYTEGGRAFSSYVALWLDLAKHGADAAQKRKAEDLVALLTPVAKAFLTDKGLETAVMGQQVFGGHGFIRESGQEQLVRDVRITQIYEGTNGVQAMDLMGRKTVANEGRLLKVFEADARAFIEENRGHSVLAEFLEPLAAELQNLNEVTAQLVAQAKEDPAAIGAAANDYTHLFGYVAFAFMWARIAAAALPKVNGSDGFYAGKVAVARFFFRRLLPQTKALTAQLLAGPASLMEPDADLF
ncbi:MAG: acyl-CoA dehydrogenase C-terminal domain-containing protein [Proteobacteria bacterium]|nr:acyl-CoA dehydrogenase C-terminal domain-containing protein [Pseudomonadota bacterium]